MFGVRKSRGFLLKLGFSLGRDVSSLAEKGRGGVHERRAEIVPLVMRPLG